MKSTFTVLGRKGILFCSVIALAAVVGLGLTGCPTDSGGNNGNNNNGGNNNGGDNDLTPAQLRGNWFNESTGTVYTYYVFTNNRWGYHYNSYAEAGESTSWIIKSVDGNRIEYEHESSDDTGSFNWEITGELLTISNANHLSNGRYRKNGTPATRPTVTGVIISPETAYVHQGGTITFTANVTGTYDPPQTVNWSIVETAKKQGTTISTDGMLTAAIDEALPYLTVKAASAMDANKNATILVQVFPPAVSEVTGVIVNPASAAVSKGGTKTFTASVIGNYNPPQTVNWSIVETAKKQGTTISTGGVLTVASDETLFSITVKATSAFNPAKSSTATVTIGQTPPELRGNWLRDTAGTERYLAFTESRWGRDTDSYTDAQRDATWVVTSGTANKVEYQSVSYPAVSVQGSFNWSISGDTLTITNSDKPNYISNGTYTRNGIIQP